ncbi:MAG: alpha/beta fold hydrolase [Marmoricola sp.]|nr:alpha/beta fold hydrolase [Marmoricola sp.]
MGLHLDRHDVPGAPAGVVLMLHGGAETPGKIPVTPLYPGYLRVRLLQRSVRDALGQAGLATWLVRNRWTSWAAPTEHDEGAPVADGRAGLEAVRAAYGGVPVVLVGHSMGARTALRLADHPQVVGLVGLAPWFPASEPVGPLRDRHLAVAVNGADTEVSPREARVFVERVGGLARSAEFRRIGDQGPGLLAHGMGFHPRRWSEFVVEQARRMVSDGVGTPPPR